jgi:2-desacetyl-2-hydroxyethyl bacteriochlorophyllide A dehydrogenase
MADRGSNAFWILAPGHGAIRAETLAAPSAAEVVVRALYSGISRGTESLVFRGLVPPSEYERMRAPFQAGEFPGPVKYGYASVGRIEEGPMDLQGRTVFVLYPHQTRYIVDADSVHLVPETVPPQRAVLAANLETAVNGLWDAPVHLGDHVTVIGAGTVGCLVAWLVRRMGAGDIELVDLNPRRATTAAALGVRFAAVEAASRDRDVVFHTSGSPSGLRLALEIAGFETTVVDLSWYGSQEVQLALGEAFHSKRLTLKSSQVGCVATPQRARWTTRRRLQLAISLLAHGELDALVTGESEFESLPAVMSQLAVNPGDALCHRIRYQSAPNIDV